MATSADQTINYQSPLGDILTRILGSQTSGTTNTSGNTTNVTGGSSTGTTSTTANIDPLLQIFSQASSGLSPEQATALITSIFQEGARAVPELTGAYANATGSRSRGNSGLQLALDDLNRTLSTNAMSAILNYNQGSQQTAANAASNIANNTRQQTQTQQQNQVQTGTQQQNQTQQQRQTVNPQSSSLLATLLGAGSVASKLGLLPSFGKNAAGATPGGAGTITGGGSIAPNASGATAPSLTNGGGASAGPLSTPAASSGFLQQPVASNPYGTTSSIGGTSAPVASTPSMSLPNFGSWPSGGITGFGGYSTPGGLLGTSLDFGFGSLPSNFNAFGTLGTDSLGSNFSFGSNPYDYGGSAGGITGIVNGAGGGTDFLGGALNGVTSGIAGIGDGISGFLSGALGGIGDFIGSFFADGGSVRDRGIGAPGDSRYGGTTSTVDPTMLRGNIFDTTRTRNEMRAGLTPMPYTMQPGTNVMVPPGTPGMPVSMGAVMELLPFLLRQGMGFADGGQVETGGSARVRNQNYMGAPIQREQRAAINYEGYAPAGNSGVGSSTPAGASPSLGGTFAPASVAAPVASAPSAMAQSATQAEINAQNWAFFNQALAAEAAANAARSMGGGSGGVGEGASPGQNEADNGAAGIGPSGVAAAPPGTTSAVAAALGLAGLSAPGLSQALSLMAMIASMVNAGNTSASAASSPTNTAADALGLDPATVAETSQATLDGLNGLATSQDSAAGGGSGVGEGSGVGAGGATGGSTSGEGGNGGGNYADGGMVSGRGTGTSDSIRVKSKQPGGRGINYSDGEYIIPADVVQALGASTFDSILDAFHTPVNR